MAKTKHKKTNRNTDSLSSNRTLTTAQGINTITAASAAAMFTPLARRLSILGRYFHPQQMHTKFLVRTISVCWPKASPRPRKRRMQSGVRHCLHSEHCSTPKFLEAVLGLIQLTWGTHTLCKNPSAPFRGHSVPSAPALFVVDTAERNKMHEKTHEAFKSTQIHVLSTPTDICGTAGESSPSSSVIPYSHKLLASCKQNPPKLTPLCLRLLRLRTSLTLLNPSHDTPQTPLYRYPCSVL